jgi:pantetheine-phosphate adenylyltransferase
VSRPVARVGHAVLGGTFDRLHAGHAALLATAVRSGRRVSVGLTTAAFLRAHPKPAGPRIQPYRLRRAALARWLSAHAPKGTWRIVPLADRFGRSVAPGVDLLVVSAETATGGKAVNRERRRRGLPEVPVAIVPLVLGDDLEPLSSRRIRAGEIDRRGRRIAPIRVAVAASDAASARAAVRGIRRAIPAARIVIAPAGPPRAARRPSARALALRARARAPLAVGVVRGRRGWTLVEASRSVVLAPRVVLGARDRDLARGVAAVVRPSRPQPL